MSTVIWYVKKLMQISDLLPHYRRFSSVPAIDKCQLETNIGIMKPFGRTSLK